MFTDVEIAEIRKLVNLSDSEVKSIVQKGLSDQSIRIPRTTSGISVYAGGTNQCPNSDFSFSELAATLSGILPATVDPLNDEVYRVYRQVKEADITTTPTRLNIADVSLEVPIWDKVAGVAQIGFDGGDDNYDLAFHMLSNLLIGNHKWYIRVALATTDETPLPEGTRLFAGFWVRRNDLSEGWVTGGPVVLEHFLHGVPGVRVFNYKVYAKTDTGHTIESQVLNVANVPAVLDDDNYIQIQYTGAAGLIEFETYREDVATGEVRQIARDRNSSRLVCYDRGQEGRLETAGFPASSGDELKAYAEIDVDAVSIDVQKTFHNIAFRIPPNFDTSNLADQGTYLRIGLLEATARRTVIVDTVWAAESYNVWSPSPYDDYPSPQSTTMTTSPAVGGGAATSNPPPTGGGSSCVWIEHDLRLEHGWVPLERAEEHYLLDSGVIGQPNRIERVKPGFTTQFFILEFDCGLRIRCSPSQRFARSLSDSSGILVTALEVGNTLLGGFSGENKVLTLVRKITCDSDIDDPLNVVALKVTPESTNKFYAVGNSETGWYVFLHNLKDIDPEIYPI